MFPVIIVSDKKINKESLLSYVQNGGCIFTEADIAEKVLEIKSKNIFIRFILPEIDEIFNQNIICDVFKYCRVIKESNHLPNQNRTNTTYATNIGKGKIIVFPSGFSSLMISSKVKRKNFYTEYGNVETNERVASISKGAIYHLIKNALENLYHHRNLPFINLWQFPNGERSVFSFRVDTDFGTHNQLNDLHNLFKENNITATWFVETKSIDNEIIDLYKSFSNQEIALHCYRHRVFNNYKENYENTKLGIEKLKNINPSPIGYVAPFGEWNEELNQSLEELGFKYSSEFSYAYDSLPFYSVIKNSISSVLQIPIHPFSFGRLNRGGHTDEAMLKYFLNTIEQKLALQEPIILYTHPSEERLKILNEIFQNINSLIIPNLTFGDFYVWWNKRASLKWEAEIIDGNIKIKEDSNENDFWLRTIFPNKEVYLAPLKSNDLKIKEIENANLKIEYKISPNEMRKTSLRMIKHDILFKYRKSKQ